MDPVTSLPVTFRQTHLGRYQVLGPEGVALGWVVLRHPRHWDAYVFTETGMDEKVDHGCMSRGDAARSILRRLDAPGWDA